MDELLLIPSAAISGYLAGSIPFAYLVARHYGVNILKEGSGNPGATNVKRAVGGMQGNAVFVLDFLKGFLAAVWPWFAAGDEQTALAAAIVALAAAILGHSFPVFLKFRGGKGVATTMGGLAAIMPLVVMIGMAVWLVAFYLSRYVSLASLCFALSLPISVVMLSEVPDNLLFYFSLAVTALIFYRHRTNIRNLLKGTELRFERTGGKGKETTRGDGGGSGR